MQACTVVCAVIKPCGATMQVVPAVCLTHRPCCIHDAASLCSQAAGDVAALQDMPAHMHTCLHTRW